MHRWGEPGPIAQPNVDCGGRQADGQDFLMGVPPGYNRDRCEAAELPDREELSERGANGWSRRPYTCILEAHCTSTDQLKRKKIENEILTYTSNANNQFNDILRPTIKSLITHIQIRSLTNAAERATWIFQDDANLTHSRVDFFRKTITRTFFIGFGHLYGPAARAWRVLRFKNRYGLHVNMHFQLFFRPRFFI